MSTNWLTDSPDYGFEVSPDIGYSSPFSVSYSVESSSPSWGDSIYNWLTDPAPVYNMYGETMTPVKDPLDYWRVPDGISLTGVNSGDNYQGGNVLSDFYRDIPDAAGLDLSYDSILDYLKSPDAMTMLGKGLDVTNKGLQVANTVNKLAPQRPQQADPSAAYRQLMQQELDRQLKARQLQASPLGQGLGGAELAMTLYKAMTANNGIARSKFENNNAQAGQGPNFAAAQAARKARGFANGGLTGVTKALYDHAKHAGLIPGDDDGQEDSIEAMLSPGEYVIDAEIVSALGDGNTEAGAKKLDEMRYNVRKHKRSGGLSSIPAKAKTVEKYLKG